MPTPFHIYPLSSCPTLMPFLLITRHAFIGALYCLEFTRPPPCNRRGSHLRLWSVFPGKQTRIHSTSSTTSLCTNNEHTTFPLTYGDSSSHSKHCLCLLQFLEVTYVTTSALNHSCWLCPRSPTCSRPVCLEKFSLFGYCTYSI
jgi:hypothetical protein